MIYKRPGSPFWYVTKTRKSTQTTVRKLAEEVAKMTVGMAWEKKHLGKTHMDWAGLIEFWEDSKGTKKSYKLDRQIIKDLSAFIFSRRLSLLQSIADSEVLQEYIKVVKRRTSPSTANRHMHTIKAMFRLARRHKWITHEPLFDPYPVIERPVGYLTDKQFTEIYAYLAPHYKPIAQVALWTGMRRENVCGLRWDWINKDMTVITVPASYTKAQKTYTALISAEAKALLETLRNESEYVFADGIGYRNGAAFGIAFRRAAVRAGFKAHVHQLRHTWASAHIQNDTPDRILMAIGGWQSPAMLSRYVHLKTEKLVQYAENASTSKSE